MSILYNRYMDRNMSILYNKYMDPNVIYVQHNLILIFVSSLIPLTREPWPLDGITFDTLKEQQAKRNPEDLEIDYGTVLSCFLLKYLNIKYVV